MVILCKAVLNAVKPRVARTRPAAQPSCVRKRPAASDDAHHHKDEEIAGVVGKSAKISPAHDSEDESIAETEDVEENIPRPVADAPSSTCTARRQSKAGRARLASKARSKASADKGTVGQLKPCVDRLLRLVLASVRVKLADADVGGNGKRVGLATDARNSLVAAIHARIERISGDAAESMRRQKPPRTVLTVPFWRAAETRGDPRDLAEALGVLKHRDNLSLDEKDVLKHIGTRPLRILVARSGVKVSTAVLSEIGHKLTEDVGRILMKAFAVTEARRGRHDGGRRIEDRDVRHAIALPRPEGFGMTLY